MVDFFCVIQLDYKTIALCHLDQSCMHTRFFRFTFIMKKGKRIGHHARPRRASATAPLRTGADMCKTGAGAGSSAGADTEPNRRQGNHKRTDDQAGMRRRSDTDGY